MKLLVLVWIICFFGQDCQCMSTTSITPTATTTTATAATTEVSGRGRYWLNRDCDYYAGVIKLYCPAFFSLPVCKVSARILRKRSKIFLSSPCLVPYAIFQWGRYLEEGKIKMARSLSSTVVKLLAKAKLKSLPYNHTDHLPHPQLSIKSIQVLHQHMRYC